MTLTYQTFNGDGSDCSGSSGDSNRVLTLSNTSLTVQAGFLVYVSGLALALTTEYTVSHLDASTEITFLNPLWDDMTIVVQYSEDAVLQNYEDRRTDFQDIITEHGTSATLIRQSETTGSMGDVSAVTDTNYNIVLSIQDITKKDRQIHEMGLAVPGNSKAFFYHEYPNSITGNGTVSVQVGDIILDEDSKRWRVEQIIGERHMLSYEIFRLGVIKNINLG